MNVWRKVFRQGRDCHGADRGCSAIDQDHDAAIRIGAYFSNELEKVVNGDDVDVCGEGLGETAREIELLGCDDEQRAWGGRQGRMDAGHG
jgi:hypothetical protein